MLPIALFHSPTENSQGSVKLPQVDIAVAPGVARLMVFSPSVPGSHNGRLDPTAESA